MGTLFPIQVTCVWLKMYRLVKVHKISKTLMTMTILSIQRKKTRLLLT